MRRLLPVLVATLALALTASASPAQTAARPAPPATLRSTLLAELHSTHDKAEWFTPINAAVAGLTPEQAKWIPTNAAGKLDPNANHSAGMLGRVAHICPKSLERVRVPHISLLRCGFAGCLVAAQSKSVPEDLRTGSPFAPF